MRSIVRFLTIAGAMALGFFAFMNFAPVDVRDRTTLPKLEKEYVKIDGKLYEKNPRGVYYIDGVPTLVKNAKAAVKAIEDAGTSNLKLGPPIDPSVLKDAMGLSADDEFFKPSKTEE